MVVIENGLAYSDQGKKLRDKKTGAIVGKTRVLPGNTADDYEELDAVPAYTEDEYKAKVRELIASRYTIEDELAIHRQKENKPEQWAKYDAYCEDCKARAKAELEAKGVNKEETKDTGEVGD